MSMSPIDHTKARCSYVAASQRDRCGNCAHVSEAGNLWSCRKNGLMVTVYAVCKHWEQPTEPRTGVPNRSKPEMWPHGAGAASSAPKGQIPGDGYV